MHGDKCHGLLLQNNEKYVNSLQCHLLSTVMVTAEFLSVRTVAWLPGSVMVAVLVKFLSENKVYSCITSIVPFFPQLIQCWVLFLSDLKLQSLVGKCSGNFQTYFNELKAVSGSGRQYALLFESLFLKQALQSNIICDAFFFFSSELQLLKFATQ